VRKPCPQQLFSCISAKVLSIRKLAQALRTQEALLLHCYLQELLHHSTVKLRSHWQLTQNSYAASTARLRGSLQQLLHILSCEVQCCWQLR
jgi:hypothetical protein